MKKQLLLYFVIGLLTLSISAQQKLLKPTQTPSEPTEAQRTLIEEGIALHDAKKYTDAMKKYQQVLKENPDCVLALYELALTFYTNRDHELALATAFKGTKYRAKELPLFFGIIANVWDDTGKAEDAIKLYQDGIKLLKDEKDFEPHISSLYYNLGVTYTRQKKFPEAREALKSAVEFNFGYASPNYMLAEIFNGTKYKVPALLAASRLISLELNSQRTERSVEIFLNILKSAKANEKGEINIFVDMNAPKDEGDFAMYDLFLGTLTTVKSEKDKSKSEEEVFAEAFDSIIAMLAEDKKIQKTFVGRNYIPFLVEMKKNGYTKIFAYLVLQQNGNKNAEKWLIENRKNGQAFLDWAKAYKPVK